ncbi:MAG: glycine oxidase ThiO [Salinisphaeraceae bacterium]|nr:glycine oxidase ThiO [Salinisphaeraceae bacterium]
MSQKGYDTVVVGGGVIGLFTAWELTKQGQSVCILERGQFGQEASWAAGGILSPLRPWKYPALVNQLALESQSVYPAICEELQALSGIDCEWRQSGMLILDCDEQEQAETWAEQSGQKLEWLSQERLQSDFPDVVASEMHSSACWLPGVAQLRNPRLIKSLVTSLEHMGVECRQAFSVDRLSLRGNRVVGVQSGAEKVFADNVVVAAGAWSSKVLADLDSPFCIYPVKGQMLLFAAGVASPGAILMRGNRYLVPRADGRILAGSTVEQAGYDKSTDADVLAQIKTDVAAIWPALNEAKIEAQWAGLRPATENEVPILGPHPAVEGLYLNTGHFRSGIVMAPASAKALTSQLLGQ